MFLIRKPVALVTDQIDGIHQGGCVACGPSLPMISTNPNSTVRYEGKLILTAGVKFENHPSPGEFGCCYLPVEHDRTALPESDPTIVSSPDDGLIKIEGKIPIHIGDIVACGPKIIKIA